MGPREREREREFVCFVNFHLSPCFLEGNKLEKEKEEKVSSYRPEVSQQQVEQVGQFTLEHPQFSGLLIAIKFKLRKEEDEEEMASKKQDG